MIFYPRVGQHVRVHYASKAAPYMPYHGKTGVVRVVVRGRGPRNVGVEIDGRLIVIPRGNLVLMPEKTPTDAGAFREENG